MKENLWEENDVTEPKMKSENSGAIGQNDITNDTKKNVTENDLKDTTKTKKTYTNQDRDLCKCGKLKYRHSNQCRTCYNKEKETDTYRIRNMDKCICGNPKYKRAKSCRKCFDKHKKAGVVTKQARRWAGYGLNPKEIESYISNHNNLCDICGKTPISERKNRKYLLDVDHDHTTNKFRGLLCAKCNRGLGSFDDNPLLIEKALVYLKKYTCHIQDPSPVQQIQVS